MNDALVGTAATIARLAGVSTAVTFEQVCNYIFMRRDAHDIPATTRPDDINGVGELLIALGADTAYWLEKIGNVVLTYPWDRSTASNQPGQLRRSSIDS